MHDMDMKHQRIDPAWYWQGVGVDCQNVLHTQILPRGRDETTTETKKRAEHLSCGLR